MRVLDVIDRVLVALRARQVEVEIEVLVALAQEVEEARRVVAHLAPQLAQRDEVAGIDIDTVAGRVLALVEGVQNQLIFGDNFQNIELLTEGEQTFVRAQRDFWRNEFIETAAQIGKLLGVDAIIVGSITQFGRDDKSRGVDGRAFGGLGRYGLGGVKQNEAKAVVAISARLIDTSTGEILAMVGSPDFNNDAISGQVNMATSPTRQPCSSIKPINYVAAFEKGWTAASLIWDVPTEFPDGANPPYVPKNYDDRFHGPVTVRTALANSFNIPAVKTLEFVGIYHDPTTPQKDGMIGMAERLGIDVDSFPLSTYRNRSFYTMRTDALDRFGTRLEHRFTRAQIREMLEAAGLERVTFSDRRPYWCATWGR